MTRLQNLFGKNKERLLSVYFTAGFPTVDSTGEILKALVAGGADMIEVGVPFSDPMADGKTIQESSTIALKNGMKLPLLLSQVAEVRGDISDTPLVLMGYLNPMMHYGIERLFETCKTVGIDALIIPDLPFDDYIRDFKPLCEKYEIPVIMLVTPETSLERMQLIDKHCDGFIYVVSTASTTGTRENFSDEQIEYFRSLNTLGLRNPRLIGFGISNKATFDAACQNASGAIIGSKFIKCLANHPDNPAAAVKELTDAIELTK